MSEKPRKTIIFPLKNQEKPRKTKLMTPHIPSRAPDDRDRSKSSNLTSAEQVSQRDHRDRLRDRPDRVQGWESVC